MEYLIIFCVLIVIIAVYLFMENGKLKQIISGKNYSIEQLNEKIGTLAKYQCCVDAEMEAERIKAVGEALRVNAAEKRSDILSKASFEASEIISSAQTKLREANYEASTIIANANVKLRDAKSEASEIIANAKAKIKENMIRSEESLNDALKKSKCIIDEAEIKAKEIAGSAYEIAKNVDFYENALVSIKNIINGYGFEYIKPLDSILDDLSESYGFTEAGKELAQARNVTKQLISNELAASCEYVEQSRRATAIAFVLDAFNGKVDTILSLIKKENYGTLEQKIKDAYSLVNLLGRPFRNARITDEYLNSRLAELKWGVAVYAIKMREKEEQRIIKERMREEERARKEYEKAMRDAEKQESAIRKAIEKATIQLSKANEEQRIKYEMHLQELEAQLLEAEAKSQRAVSMAQQTKSGHVYIISNIGSFGENIFKIGMTRRLEPLDRIRELGDASVPFPFDVHAMIYSEDAPALENELHKFFAINQVNKVNPRKEFFRLPLNDVKNYIDKKELNVQWTILAEAAQYRETKALEEAFKGDKAMEQKWEQKMNDEIEAVKNIDEEINLDLN